MRIGVYKTNISNKGSYLAKELPYIALFKEI
jgi:hypothetical protein